MQLCALPTGRLPRSLIPKSTASSRPSGRNANPYGFRRPQATSSRFEPSGSQRMIADVHGKRPAIRRPGVVRVPRTVGTPRSTHGHLRPQDRPSPRRHRSGRRPGQDVVGMLRPPKPAQLERVPAPRRRCWSRSLGRNTAARRGRTRRDSCDSPLLPAGRSRMTFQVHGLEVDGTDPSRRTHPRRCKGDRARGSTRSPARASLALCRSTDRRVPPERPGRPRVRHRTGGPIRRDTRPLAHRRSRS